MLRSRLPVSFLLSLLGALLMLCPELPLGKSEILSPVPFTDAGLQEALAFAVEEYNQKAGCGYYFKQLRLLQALTQLDTRAEYHLKVELVKTKCKKKPRRKMKYKKIQSCQLQTGNHKKPSCYFKVVPQLPQNETIFTTIACL